MHRLGPVLALLAAGCGSSDPRFETAAQDLGRIDGWTDEALDVYFIPGGDEAEDRIAAELASAERRIRVAMYNLRSRRLGALLLARQRAGVFVQVLWE